MIIRVFRQIYSAHVVAAVLLAGCSSLQSVQAPTLPKDPAPVLDLPHPSGFAMTDLKAIFLTPDSPERESLRACGVEFDALNKKTELRDEIRGGARELVIENPKRYHWCFYEKILELDEGLRNAKLLDEKQTLTLNAFKFAIPIARAFQIEFKDSRYLRWAIQRYRSLSPIVFHRRVELTPEATAELAILENPFGIWKPIPETQSILQKYGIREVAQKPPASRAPAAEGGSSPNLSDEEVSRLFEEISH